MQHYMFLFWYIVKLINLEEGDIIWHQILNIWDTRKRFNSDIEVWTRKTTFTECRGENEPQQPGREKQSIDN